MSVRLFDLYGVRASAIGTDLPVPVITSIDDGDQQLTVHFSYDDSVFPVTDVEYSLDGGEWVSSGMSASPIVISGLTNGQTYSVRVRIVSGTDISEPSNPETGTPATVPEAPTIDSINSGNGEMFIYYTLGADGGSPITGIQFRLDGGAWSGTQALAVPLIVSLPNETSADVEIRAINSVDPSDPSNIVTGEAEDRIELQRYFAIDTDLFSLKDNLTFETVELGNQFVLHHADVANDTPDEPWERLVADPPNIENPKAAFARGIPGTLLVDHEGYLRCYYNLMFNYVDDEGTKYQKRGLALQKSTNGGTSWFKDRVNLNPEVRSHVDSNLIDFPAPTVLNNDDEAFDKAFDLGAVRMVYDPISEKYIALSTWRNDGRYFISTSDKVTGEGIHFNTPVPVLSNIPGDDNPGSIFYDEKEGKWTIAFRGRQRPTGGPAAHPTPYYYTRFLALAVSDGTSYDDNYSMLVDGGGYPRFIVDPAIIYEYDDAADQEAFWDLVDVGGSCPNDSFRNKPASGTEPTVRTDFQVTPVRFYAGQYFCIPSAYFRDDNRSPYIKHDRTDGPTYPVWGHAREREGYADHHLGENNGVKGGWKFPDKNRPAVATDLESPAMKYKRVDNNECNLSDGAEEVGRVSSGCGFVVHPGTNRIVAAVIVASTLEEQRSFGVNTDVPLTWTVATHYTKEDRFAKLEAGGTEGVWRTSKLRVPDGATSLLINSDGSVYVELLNVITDTPIEGFTKADADEITVNEIDNPATWSSHSIDELARQNVRVKIYITNGSVYSFRFE